MPISLGVSKSISSLVTFAWANSITSATVWWRAVFARGCLAGRARLLAAAWTAAAPAPPPCGAREFLKTDAHKKVNFRRQNLPCCNLMEIRNFLCAIFKIWCILCQEGEFAAGKKTRKWCPFKIWCILCTGVARESLDAVPNLCSPQIVELLRPQNLMYDISGCRAEVVLCQAGLRRVPLKTLLGA